MTEMQSGNYKKGKLLYEGKAKKVFAVENAGGFLIQEFKDSLTAFNAQKKGSFENKGVLNAQITALIFNYLKSKGVATHLVSKMSERDLLVKKLIMIPLEVVVRNKMAGSLSARLGIAEGTSLSTPCVEFYYKKDELNDPLVTIDHIFILKAASASDVEELRELALKVDQALIPFFRKADLELVDFKLEFGKTADGEIMLGDEITPDSCRLWDVKTQEKMDKDRFRRDLGRVAETYAEVYRRLVEVSP